MLENGTKKEVSDMFDNNIQKLIPREEISNYYYALSSERINVKHKYLSLICSFKWKSHPGGSLNKQMAVLYFYEGQKEESINFWDT